eukprot:541355-Alexandrium_andersonii.AAC.1
MPIGKPVWRREPGTAESMATNIGVGIMHLNTTPTLPPAVSGGLRQFQQVSGLAAEIASVPQSA